MPNIGASFIAGVLCYIFRDELKELCKAAYDYLVDKIFSQLIIKIEDDPKCLFAIGKELIRQNLARYRAKDSRYFPEYNLASGCYHIRYNGYHILIVVTDEEVKLFLPRYGVDILKNYLNDIYKEHCSPQNVITFYVSEERKWGFPIFRRPRNRDNMRITDDMRKVLNDVGEFIGNERNYRNKSIPYRRGYLLCGKPGTGKSTIVEFLAMRYNMSVYLVNLNMSDMDDANLVSLLGKIPPNSLIVFEEIEKQLDTIVMDSQNKVSYGGILSAIDGPQRLSNGSIIILTANRMNTIDKNFMESLMRKGRIDKQFRLDEPV